MAGITMQDVVDRAALIEAASRGVRGAHGVHDGGEPRAGESAQRRIRSAENQHRVITEHRDGPLMVHALAQTPSTSALDRYTAEDELEEDVPHFHQDFHQDLKRPLSRKKDPSASAAAGLGAFAGPSRMVDAFEQRKTKQPIPVDSWGPRPPSRAGPPQKAAVFDGCLDGQGNILVGASRGSRLESGSSSSLGRPSKAAGEALGSKAGGTRASAWAEPRGLSSEARRGRERKAANRSSPEAQVPYAPDFGIFGVGAVATFQAHGGFRSPQGPARSAGQWASHVDAAGASHGLHEDRLSPSSRPDSPAQTCGSPPTRKGRQSFVEAVSVEDVEHDCDLGLYGTGLHGSYRRDTTPPQVIVTRSSKESKSRGDSRRGSDTRGSRERSQRDMPFSTSLDVDFLSLFAS
mmetsp:Transcript_34121/g.106445  ORF Transcript_34121/g.106445 Transcript_34121/m.106445 type:complete len:405 (+) Transcript_34121:75-1289(+)